MDSPPRPKGPSPSGDLPALLPKTDTGFFVNYQVIGDVAKALDAEAERQEQSAGEAAGWESTGPLPGPDSETGPGEKSGGKGLSYYEQPIRQEAHVGDWHASDREVYELIHQMSPDRTERAGSIYRHTAKRVHESREVLHAQATKLVTGWKGPAADGALRALQRLYELGRHLVDASWQIGLAYQWHADKQRAWQGAVQDDGGSSFGDWLNWNSDDGRKLKDEIQNQTVETNAAFPESASSV
jgi:hypothetical protein